MENNTKNQDLFGKSIAQRFEYLVNHNAFGEKMKKDLQTQILSMVDSWTQSKNFQETFSQFVMQRLNKVKEAEVPQIMKFHRDKLITLRPMIKNVKEKVFAPAKSAAKKDADEDVLDISGLDFEDWDTKEDLSAKSVASTGKPPSPKKTSKSPKSSRHSAKESQRRVKETEKSLQSGDRSRSRSKSRSQSKSKSKSISRSRSQSKSRSRSRSSQRRHDYKKVRDSGRGESSRKREKSRSKSPRRQDKKGRGFDKKDNSNKGEKSSRPEVKTDDISKKRKIEDPIQKQIKKEKNDLDEKFLKYSEEKYGGSSKNYR